MTLLDNIKERLKTTQQKFSAVLIVVFGILWFVYFIVACTYLADPINSDALRVWVTKPPTETPDGSRVFPQFTICPHGSLQGAIVSLQCDNYDWYQGQLVKTLKPVYLSGIFSDFPDWTCYSYNSDGADSSMDFVNCSGIVTPDCTALHAFFDDPGSGKDFFDGTNRPSEDDNWINPKGTRNDIGITLSIWDTTDPTGGPVGKTSIDDPTRKYNVNAQTVSSPQGNLTSFNIWWGSAEVWHYEKHSPFVFFHWIGFIGGAAFLLKMLYDVIMAIFNVLCPAERQGYSEMK
jgi:hypothetical protein